MMSDIQPTPESEKPMDYRYMKSDSKSDGWSDSQKEAIRKQMRTFIGDIVLELGSKGIHAKDVSKWIDYKTDMALAITKGEQWKNKLQTKIMSLYLTS